MSDIVVPRVGAVLSADIAVPDHEREVRFYSRVLSTGDDPLWREDLMNNLGIPIIGLGALSPEYADLPLQWMPHIQVADVAASVKRTTELGGSVLMQSTDDSGNSKWAVLLDPNGAAFGVVPVVVSETGTADEAGVPSEAAPQGTAASDGAGASVGRIAWVDLTVPDASTTRDFYHHVVGWSVQDVAMKDAETRYADYNMLDEAGTPAAGVCHARGGNGGLPPVWMIYLPVGDLPESLRRVEQEGGCVIRTVNGPDSAPAYAVIQDPVGASLALMQA